MSISLSTLSTDLGPTGTDLITVIVPYLPALAREGQEVYTGFIDSMINGDMEAVDTLMYPKMTLAERQKLEAQVFTDAVAAVQAMVDRETMMKTLAWQIALKLLTTLI